MSFVQDHPVGCVVGGVGVAAAIGLIMWLSHAVSSRKASDKAVKAPEEKRAEEKERRRKWSDDREAELDRDGAFAQYLDICIAIQKKRNEFIALRREQEKLHDEEMELSSKATELYSKCVEFGAHSSLYNDFSEEWGKINRRLGVLRVKLGAIYQRLRELPEEIDRLEEQRLDLQKKYKNQLGDFEKVKSKDAKK